MVFDTGRGKLYIGLVRPGVRRVDLLVRFVGAGVHVRLVFGQVNVLYPLQKGQGKLRGSDTGQSSKRLCW